MLAQILANLLKVPFGQACEKVYFVYDLTYTWEFLCIGLNRHESQTRDKDEKTPA